MNLKEERLRFGYSQQRLANEAGITVRYYQYLEKGEYKPSVDVAKKIAEILDFDWTQFFQEENK